MHQELEQNIFSSYSIGYINHYKKRITTAKEFKTKEGTITKGTITNEHYNKWAL